MSEGRALLLETAERAFSELGADASFEEAWDRVSALGFESLLASEADGGFGGDWGDAFAVLRCAGGNALPLPLGEVMVAAKLAASCGASLSGSATLAELIHGKIDAAGRFTGRMSAPWGSNVRQVFFDVAGELAMAIVGDAKVEKRFNPAGESRDLLVFEASPVSLLGTPSLSALAAGAFVRVAQMAGAMDAALATSIQYANERQQFGKQIGKFQAVQQALAMFAEEAAAVNCAGQAAARALDYGDAAFEVAAAKARANIAADFGTATAHQVHGAIGFTQEHALHRLTRRLMSWRSEFGGERFWSEYLGKRVCAGGADAFWTDLTTRDNAR